MKLERAQEILNSQNRIPVQYKGRSIWISSLNPLNNTAIIKYDIFSDNGMEVSIQDLME